ncbi:MAG: hypothetical protein DRJ32_03145 [Thermoprotei archaeon]|nr:MAG: hypothetical protein DRJ32_03145 [Thermoprotei archaeon]
MVPEKVIVVLHNVYSPYRVVETSKIVYSMGFKVLVVSKALGAAAQIGVPEAQKIALKKNRCFMYLPDLPDVVELFPSKNVLLFSSKESAIEETTFSELFLPLLDGERIILVFSGIDTGFTKRELNIGKPIYIRNLPEISSLGLIAITLHELRKFLEKENYG